MSDKKTETWWVLNSYRGTIQPVEVIKSTEKTITLENGRVQYKNSSYEMYFPTWKDARDHSLNVCNSKIEYHRNIVRDTEKVKAHVLSLVDPADGGVTDGSNRSTGGWIGQP